MSLRDESNSVDAKLMSACSRKGIYYRDECIAYSLGNASLSLSLSLSLFQFLPARCIHRSLEQRSMNAHHAFEVAIAGNNREASFSRGLASGVFEFVRQ